jgi:hypothetical protein
MYVGGALPLLVSFTGPQFHIKSMGKYNQEWSMNKKGYLYRKTLDTKTNTQKI